MRRREIAAWLATHAGQGFACAAKACGDLQRCSAGRSLREPLNIAGHSPGAMALISNFAKRRRPGRARLTTPRVLAGLAICRRGRQAAVAALGERSRDAGTAPSPPSTHYAGARVRMGPLTIGIETGLRGKIRTARASARGAAIHRHPAAGARGGTGQQEHPRRAHGPDLDAYPGAALRRRSRSFLANRPAGAAILTSC